jgi:regulatory protein
MRKARLDGEALWQYAVRALARRAHSAAELRAKLLQRAEKASDVEPALARLKDLGYLNDRRFAETFAAARLDAGKVGRLRVLHDLRARRVAPAVAEQTVNSVYRDVDEPQLIDDYLRRKLHLDARPQLLADEKQLAAAFRRLMRAGFSRGNVVRALKQYTRDAAALAAMEAAGDAPEEEA